MGKDQGGVRTMTGSAGRGERRRAARHTRVHEKQGGRKEKDRKAFIMM